MALIFGDNMNNYIPQIKYDAWKLDTPPEYDQSELCNDCDERLIEDNNVELCVQCNNKMEG